mgnify:CR=1 FL=1
MTKDTKSFFERLTGAQNIDQEEHDEEEEVDLYDDEEEEYEPDKPNQNDDEEKEEGELAIDMYETPNDIIIKTVVSGVKPEELDISITREKVTVRGTRVPERGFEGSNYHVQELYWGPFSRSVNLPEEVEVDEAEAIAKHGLLILKLPKINKERETKLKVKTS